MISALSLGKEWEERDLIALSGTQYVAPKHTGIHPGIVEALEGLE